MKTSARLHHGRMWSSQRCSRAVPAGVDFWDFDCRVGASEPESAIAHVAELGGLVDSVAQAGSAGVYVEILAKHGHRKARSSEQA